MLLQANIPKRIVHFNKHGLDLRWPRIWIIIVGIILIFLTFCIAGMEIGHTVFDLRRSTAFGGFILFLPLLGCAILVLVTAFKPRLLLVRIAVILCLVMIVLCMVLIAYDTLVEIDPTRCFFFNCNYATINASNSTTNIVVSGWPIYISWPAYFQTNMNAKRIFQGIQIAAVCLFILFAALYILTYFIYRKINLQQLTKVHNAERRVHGRLVTPTSPSDTVPQSPPEYDSHRQVKTYTMSRQTTPFTKDRSSSVVPVVKRTIVIRTTKKKPVARPRANSMSYDRICTNCMEEPRMILYTNFERQNYFSHLCASCNDDYMMDRRKGVRTSSSSTRIWKP